MSKELVDIEGLVKSWVSKFANFLVPDEKKDMDEVNSADIDWSYLRIKHGATEYQDTAISSAPTKNVLSTCYFLNDTRNAQVYSLKSERRTKSVCNITMEKSYTIGYSLDIKIMPPNPVVEANAGFKGQQTIRNADCQTFEEEMVWSVNSNVTVPPEHEIRADLVLKEEDFSSSFKCETRFDGMVCIDVRNRRNNTVSKSLRVPVQKIFKPEHGFHQTRNGVSFVSHGKCTCRFGIEQEVSLSQKNLAAVDSHSEW